MEKSPSLMTIIIPTFNCEKYLEATLKCLVAQTNPNFEVLIIDDRSFDRTAKIAAEYAKDLKLIFFRKTNKMRRGAAASINDGFSKITTKYWGLLDSDAFLKPNWVATMIKLLAKSADDDVFGAPILASKKGGLVAYLIGLEIESRYQKLNEGHLRHLSTCNIAGKTKILKYIKLNEDLDYAYDHELSFQLKTKRILFFLTKQTSCEHVNKSGFFQYFRQQYKIAKYHLALSKKMPKQAIRGDEISPNYLILQPLAILGGIIILFYWAPLALIFLGLLVGLNLVFLRYLIKEGRLLYLLPALVLIIVKNFSWLAGAVAGVLTTIKS